MRLGYAARLGYTAGKKLMIVNAENQCSPYPPSKKHINANIKFSKMISFEKHIFGGLGTTKAGMIAYQNKHHKM